MDISTQNSCPLTDFLEDLIHLEFGKKEAREKIF